ncbi:hypothetical protein GCM10011390_35550 [Aureimonas endophytica]|uniref:Uncharacterized protein n=1 Tax=Aureimonas endophytica TaxID=2027858 RepID=A0A916ZTI6_9HYPH|nr:hypothetical protein [Aureimonas endophytica]GGE13370.1 hypothetical protein GCM10011390_35550 [Aureimonas endophytica]
MPTLVRLLTTLGLVVAVVLAAMAALVYLVEPVPHQVVIDVPLRLDGGAASVSASGLGMRP